MFTKQLLKNIFFKLDGGRKLLYLRCSRNKGFSHLYEKHLHKEKEILSSPEYSVYVAIYVDS